MKKHASKFLALMISSLVAFSVFTPVSASAAAGKKVSVSLPRFSVTLNGTAMDSKKEQYPLIVYKNITYFPMTYNHTRFLGLDTLWENKSGLTIEKAKGKWDYQGYPTSRINPSSQLASIPTFPVRVNGKIVDNSKEEYPLLSFRNITYFPLTWKYAVSEFGWDYKYDDKDGLVITSKNQNDVAVKQIDIKKLAPKFNAAVSSSLVKNGYLYYPNDKKVLRVKLDNLAKKEVALDYKKLADFQGDDFEGYFKSYQGGDYFVYHTGGAVMGNDLHYKIDGALPLKEAYAGYPYLFETDKYKGNIYFFAPPSTENYEILDKTTGKEIKFKINEKGFYGRNISGMAGAALGETKAVIKGDMLYTTFAAGEDWAAKDKLYSFNLKTLESKKLFDNAVNRFTMTGDKLYFLDKDDVPYVGSVNGNDAKKVEIKDTKASDFIVGNGFFYYTKRILRDDIPGNAVGNLPTKNMPLLDISGKAINGDATVESMSTRADGNYSVVKFMTNNPTENKIMIFDKNGKVIYESIDKAYDAFYENGIVYLIK